MLAILVVIETKYTCNLDHVEDQICLQQQFRQGPYMPTISVSLAKLKLQAYLVPF